MHVVLDTSELFADLTLTGPLSRLLLDRARRGSYTLVVPEVVRIEVVNHARERIEAAVEKIQRAHSSLRKLEVWSDGPVIDGAPLVESFGDAFDRKVTETTGVIATIPVVEHRELAIRSARGVKPFTRPPQGGKGKSDKGYRDALIWMTVLETAKTGSDVVFVTSNSDDFSDGKGRLHEDLVAELESLGLADRVRVSWSLKSFLEDNVPPDEHGLTAFRQKLMADPAFEAALHEQVERIIGNYDEWGGFVDVDFVRLSPDDLRREHRPEEVHVYAYEILGISASRAYEFGTDDDEGVIELEVKAEVSADLLFHKSDAQWLIELGSEVSIDDWDYNETMASGSSTVYVEAKLHLLFDHGSGRYDGPDIVEVATLPTDDPARPSAAGRST